MPLRRISSKITALILIGLLASCGASEDESSVSSFVDATLGPTEMKRCRIIGADAIGMDDMVAELSRFANNNGLKFLDDRASGRNGSYLQIDDPYVVIDHMYFSQRKPPEHMLISFRSPDSSSGDFLESTFFDFIDSLGTTKSCDGFISGISPGWRLPE